MGQLWLDKSDSENEYWGTKHDRRLGRRLGDSGLFAVASHARARSWSDCQAMRIPSKGGIASPDNFGGDLLGGGAPEGSRKTHRSVGCLVADVRSIKMGNNTHHSGGLSSGAGAVAAYRTAVQTNQCRYRTQRHTQLRSRIPDNHYLPILVLTADVAPKAKQQALSLGARTF